MYKKLLTPKEYFDIATFELEGHAQPLYMKDGKYFIYGGMRFHEDDDSFYILYIQSLHRCGIPNFERIQNIDIDMSNMFKDVSKSPEVRAIVKDELYPIKIYWLDALKENPHIVPDPKAIYKRRDELLEVIHKFDPDFKLETLDEIKDVPYGHPGCLSDRTKYY